MCPGLLAQFQPVQGFGGDGKEQERKGRGCPRAGRGRGRAVPGVGRAWVARLGPGNRPDPNSGTRVMQNSPWLLESTWFCITCRGSRSIGVLQSTHTAGCLLQHKLGLCCPFDNWILPYLENIIRICIFYFGYLQLINSHVRINQSTVFSVFTHI